MDSLFSLYNHRKASLYFSLSKKISKQNPIISAKKTKTASLSASFDKILWVILYTSFFF